MKDLERAKKELELKKISLAKEEMKYKILERMADIERLEENIKKQEEAEERVKQELSK